MPYVIGVRRGDLQRIIRKLIKDNCRNVAEEKIWSIFIQVALGLYYLHSRGVRTHT